MVDAASVASVLCDRGLGRRHIQEPRIADVVLVNRQHEAGADVADVVCGKHAALPDLMLHTKIELVRTRVAEVGIKCRQTLRLADLQGIANVAGVRCRPLRLHSRLELLLQVEHQRTGNRERLAANAALPDPLR